MQHQPHLTETLENLLKGKLKETSYPFVENQPGVGPNSSLQRYANPNTMLIRFVDFGRPQDIIIFMVGGTTYEEARHVALLNQELAGAGSVSAGTRILLGGASVHNSSRYATFGTTWQFATYVHPTSYLAMLQAALPNFPATFTQPPAEIPSSSFAPSLNVQLGSINLSVGGAGGTGVYRGNGDGVGIQAEGIRDGVKNLFDKVKQGVESIGLP